MNERGSSTVEAWANDFISGLSTFCAKPNGDDDDDLNIIQAIPSYKKAHPTPDHLLPFLVALAWTRETNQSFILENIDQWSYGSLSLATLVSSNL
jgi:aromatic ring-opening dioxygenase catalytic subunit (LigB family)